MTVTGEMMITFDKLTIVILASNEQKSLRETLNILSDIYDPEDIAEILVFLKSADCLAKKELDKIRIEENIPFPLREYVQTIPGFNEMFYEAPLLVNSSHFLLIGADLEMNPYDVPSLISESKKHPDAIVCASKWHKDSTREGYRFLHMIGVRFINFVSRLIIGSKGTELIATFEIYPTEIHRKMNFVNQKRSYYGFTLKPLLYGYEYIEIPTHYIQRSEGKSNLHTFKYLRIGLTMIDTAVKLKLEKKRLDRAEKKKSASTQ